MQYWEEFTSPQNTKSIQYLYIIISAQLFMTSQKGIKNMWNLTSLASD
jgi:hypothetical protein